MGVIVGHNQYGKAEVRMVAVDRSGAEHSFVDLTVGITLSGDLDAVHETGDNANVVPTDTQKNTVFAFAREEPVGEIEAFGLRLARHFAGSFASITRARVHVSAASWARLAPGGEPHPHAFALAGDEVRTATVVVSSSGEEHVVSGLGGLVVMKTTGSEFTDYVVDRYTTLQPATDRILCTAVTARWRHVSVRESGWDSAFSSARDVLLEQFAVTHSLSLQQTLHRMGAGVLETVPGIAEIRLSLPNRHHFVQDLTPFGLDNPNTIFRVEDRPYGLIEAQLLRDDAPDPGAAWDPYPML